MQDFQGCVATAKLLRLGGAFKDFQFLPPPGELIQFDYIHQKLNGTESQRTPFSKLRSNYSMRYSGFFGVSLSSVGPSCGSDFLDYSYFFSYLELKTPGSKTCVPSLACLPNRTSPTPPPAGWHVPWDGAVDPTLKWLAVAWGVTVRLSGPQNNVET